MSVEEQGQMYIGWYVEKIQKELIEKEKNHLFLAENFLEILDGINVILFSKIHTPLHENNMSCSCDTFIKHHLDWLFVLENKINHIINRDVSVDTNACWVIQMHNKYKLIHHLLVRNL